jgi:hypothetical protein
MDRSTRIAVRRQIDSVMRKRLGLRQVKHVSTIPKRSHKHGVWKDGEIATALKRIADQEGCPIEELQLRVYRRYIQADPGCAPSMNTIKGRLLAGVAGCPERLA